MINNNGCYTLHRLKVRGHSVFWNVGKNVPDWVKALDASALLPTLNNHLDYMINLARGKSVTFCSFFASLPYSTTLWRTWSNWIGASSHFSLFFSYLPYSTTLRTTWSDWIGATSHFSLFFSYLPYSTTLWTTWSDWIVASSHFSLFFSYLPNYTILWTTWSNWIGASSYFSLIFSYLPYYTILWTTCSDWTGAERRAQRLVHLYNIQHVYSSTYVLAGWSSGTFKTSTSRNTTTRISWTATAPPSPCILERGAWGTQPNSI